MELQPQLTQQRAPLPYAEPPLFTPYQNVQPNIGSTGKPVSAPFLYPDDPSYVAPRVMTQPEYAQQATRQAIRQQVAEANRQPALTPTRPRIPNSLPEARPPLRGLVKKAPWTFPSNAPAAQATRRVPRASSAIYRPAPTSTANNPTRLGQIPRTPGTGQAAVSIPRAPVRGAPKPPMSIPGPRGGISTGTGAATGAALAAQAVVGIAQGQPLEEAIGAALGAAAGTAGGAIAGGALGTLVGGPPGAAIGAAIGASFAGTVGANLGAAITDSLTPDLPPGSTAGSPALAHLPPFTGGQSVGVSYVLTYEYTTTSGSTASVSSGAVTGPVSGMRVVQRFNNFGQYLGSIDVFVTLSGGEARIINIGSSGNPYSARNFRFLRTDGRPDTGGNPPGAIISPAAPRPAQSLNPNPPTPTAVGNGSPAAPPKPNQNPAQAPPALRPLPPTPAAVPAGEAVPSQLPANPAAAGEVDPSQAPAAAPQPAGTPLTIGSGAQKSAVPGGEVKALDKESPDEWTATLSNGQKVSYKKNPDGSTTLSLPNGNWQGLGALAATVGASLVGIAVSSPGLKPVPKGTPAPLGTALAPRERIVSAPKNEVVGPPEPPKQYQQTTNPCGCNTPLLNALGDLDGKLSTLVGAGGEAASTAAVLKKLQEMQQYAEQAWSSTRIQKVIDALTLISSLHNAYYLSQDIGSTVGEMISLLLDTVGIDDEAGNPLDINSMLGSAVKSLLNNALGEEVVNDIGSSLTKASRIYQAGSNVIYSLRNLTNSTTDLLEITANNTGKIGNALKRSGVVDALSYPYFSENYRASDTTRRRIQNMLDGLEQVDDTVGTFYAAVSTVREVQEEITEAGQAKDRLIEEVRTLTPREDVPENEPIAAQATQSVEASQSPSTTPSDLDPSDGTP